MYNDIRYSQISSDESSRIDKNDKKRLTNKKSKIESYNNNKHKHNRQMFGLYYNGGVTTNRAIEPLRPNDQCMELDVRRMFRVYCERV